MEINCVYCAMSTDQQILSNPIVIRPKMNNTGQGWRIEWEGRKATLKVSELIIDSRVINNEGDFPTHGETPDFCKDPTKAKEITITTTATEEEESRTIILKELTLEIFEQILEQKKVWNSPSLVGRFKTDKEVQEFYLGE